MGEDSSKGTVTDYDAPHRIEYAEPDWAALAGHADATVTPLVTEFLVEAQSGGTCVLRVVEQRVRCRRGLGAGVLRGDGEGLDAVLREPAALPRALPGPEGDVAVGRRAGARTRGRGVVVAAATRSVRRTSASRSTHAGCRRRSNGSVPTRWSCCCALDRAGAGISRDVRLRHGRRRRRWPASRATSSRSGAGLRRARARRPGRRGSTELAVPSS